MKLFSTSFIHVLMVSANVVFISNKNLLGMLFASFLISYVWTLNVKKIAVANIIDRLHYSAGAALGSLACYLLASIIQEFYK